MEMTGEYRIPANRAAVWAALNDPEVLKACIPGCQELAKVSDSEMTAKVVAKVGPVKATFLGNVTLSNIRPPEGYTISGEGKGGVAGFAKGGADVALAEDGGATVLRYTAKAQVGGKLAQIGARLIDATAKQMADEFFGAFAARLTGPAPAAPAAEVAAAAPAHDESLVERAEHAVEDAAHAVEDAAVKAEERAEVAAGRGFLGGPQVWGLIALVVVIIVLFILSRGSP
jgi:carbon monoxide dehydrogenase subunit G